MRREALEETGLKLGDVQLRAVVTFIIEGGVCEHMFLFKTSNFHGELIDCNEGVLEWVPKDRLYSLDL